MDKVKRVKRFFGGLLAGLALFGGPAVAGMMEQQIQENEQEWAEQQKREAEQEAKERKEFHEKYSI